MGIAPSGCAVSEDEFVGDRLAFYELLLQHTEDAIVAVDRDWLITVWSEGAERMYGWSAVEALAIQYLL